MRVPLTWLREYCDPDLDVAGVEERLTMTGTKVEAIHHHGVSAAERFVVGRVIACERHPNADRLSVCTVELGQASDDGPATIVCGAPNVAAGQTVAVALPGAVLPDGMEIKRAKLRGVVSEGMICAERELDIGPGGEGILVLDDLVLDADRSEIDGISDRPAPGTPLADVLPIATEVIELEVTSNRPDCLGVYGVARELHAATGAPLASEPWREDPGSPGAVTGAEVTVQCPDLCPRFTARVFEHVTVAPSPPWLAARLSAAGQRPINNVVDITNYAMLLTGQPLHAFDLDRVADARLTVRRAADGEQVRTLDGQTRTLDSEMVVIDDADGPTSIAGLMGGERSEVQPDTTRVLLEVANWHGPSIHRASWALGLRSEASSRFEKGLAPEQCLWAQAVATRLMIECCGATVLPGTIDIGGDGPPPPAIGLREARVQAILGIEIPRARQAEILNALDFETADMEGGLEVTPPPARREDVAREADLIEEVARIDGLERLPATLPARRGAYGVLSHEQRLRRRALDALVGRGCSETVGWTFASPSLADRLRLEQDDPRRDAPIVENPLSEEQSRLRTTLLGSLLDTAARNVARGMGDLRLFEVGTVFASAGTSPQSDAPDGSSTALDVRRETGVAERRSLAVLLAGELHEPNWGVSTPAPAADFYAVKGMLEALTSALRVSPIELSPDPQPFLHPGRAAALAIGAGEPIGWLGELHPLVAASWELPGASVFEIDLDRLIAAAPAQTDYEDLIGYPPLRQDLAVVLPQDVPVATVLSAARDAGGKLLRDAHVFDVYTGAQVGEGRRSLALALSFRSSERTLSDADVAPARERILAALGELGGELRG
ncbi:MAG TPA: phenylalanine--tRNA ligase subunit beta [Solirubrobacteraceae bacterium]|jgi:phenylalanyl-tRNA synthetase beta chain|nr:phenylalanine--tRNA ligase subunit beta [Solirubrobacteraceae bacterium]